MKHVRNQLYLTFNDAKYIRLLKRILKCRLGAINGVVVIFNDFLIITRILQYGL